MITSATPTEETALIHLDHCISHEVILKPLQLKLKYRRKINEKDSFLCILQ
jgi:hypothetical protein